MNSNVTAEAGGNYTSIIVLQQHSPVISDDTFVEIKPN